MQMRDMHVNERTEGDYRIYAAALTAPEGSGYNAAVVIKRLHGDFAGEEAYRDTRLEQGRRWMCANEALAFALDTGSRFALSVPSTFTS